MNSATRGGRKRSKFFRAPLESKSRVVQRSISPRSKFTCAAQREGGKERGEERRGERLSKNNERDKRDF